MRVPCQNGPLSGLVRCTRPYCNKCIILVIRDLFFTGGDTSFASCFGHLFPVHQDRDCVLVHEVPVPMVALVSTVVSQSFTMPHSVLIRIYFLLALCLAL